MPSPSPPTTCAATTSSGPHRPARPSARSHQPGTRVTLTDRDGQVHYFEPDAGWGYRPGKRSPLPAPPGGAIVDNQPDWSAYTLPGRVTLDTETMKPWAVDYNFREGMYKAFGLTAGADPRRISAAFEDVVVDDRLVDKLIRSEDQSRLQYANRILPTLQNPNEVWIAEYANGEFRKHYIKGWADGKVTLVIVAETHEGSNLVYNFIPISSKPRKINKKRKGALVYLKGDGG